MAGVQTIDEIRHGNLQWILDQLSNLHGKRGAIQRLAEKMDRTHSQVSQLARRMPHSKTGKPRNIGPSVARLIERAAGDLLPALLADRPPGWLDHVGGGELESEEARLRRIGQR